LALGVGGTLVVLGVGLVTSFRAVHDAQLSLDQRVAADRIPILTSLAEGLTVSATPELAGVAALVLIPLVLFAVRRRGDALRALFVMGGALTLALVSKVVIGEARPPQSLWAMPADSGASYPSGHTTVVAGIIVALLVVARTIAARTLIGLAGGTYVLAVAASRVYVTNHYPLDVVGSLLTAVAAGFVVAGLFALPAVARWTNRWEAPHQSAPVVVVD
jgi:undecaprenyl-diphosphatase